MADPISPSPPVMTVSPRSGELDSQSSGLPLASSSCFQSVSHIPDQVVGLVDVGGLHNKDVSKRAYCCLSDDLCEFNDDNEVLVFRYCIQL